MDQASQGNAEALSGLDSEDMKILTDLQSEGHEVAGLTPEKPAEVVEPPKEQTAPKQDEPEKEPEKDPEPEPPKKEDQPRSRTVPAWELAKREKEWEKEKTNLLSELEALRQNPTKPVAETQDDVKAIVEKYGITDEGFVRDLIAAASKRTSQLPADLSDKLKEFEEIAKATRAQAEEQAFGQDFEKEVLPLVRAEYPDISDADVARIRQDIRSNAYSDKFLNTPLAVIYKGLDSFRGVVSPKKKTAENGRGGEGRTLQVDLSTLSEEDAANLSTEDFIKWGELQATKERTS